MDKYLGGSDYNPVDIRTIDYTLTEDDYKSIVDNRNNIARAIAMCISDTTPYTELLPVADLLLDSKKKVTFEDVKDSLGIADATSYYAFAQIATDLAFNKVALADVYVPAFLTAKFPQFSAGSIVNLTYNYLGTDSITAIKATFSLSDVWGSSIYYKQAIAGDADQGKLVIQNVIMDAPLSYVWSFTSNYGMKATAYVGGVNHPSESWVITPGIDLSRAKNPQLSFDQARKYGVDFLKECFVMVSTDYAGDVTKCTWDYIPFNKDAEGKYIVPDGSSWTFMGTGEMDLTSYVGNTVYIGFKYTSSAEGSATWEFKNLLVAEPQE